MLNLFEAKTAIKPSLLSVFDEIRHHLYPTYRYLQGNCHCNAHLASLILRKHEIKHKKIWIFAPCRYLADSKEAFLINDSNQIAPKQFIRWGYHVAPIIEAAEENWIFDFNFSEQRPITLAEWLQHLNAKNFKCVIEDADSFLFYSEPISEEITKKIFKGDFYKLEGESLENHWFEKGLATNETALMMYEEVFLRAIETNISPELILDYKLLIGSVNNFECVFRDQLFNKKMTPKFQKKHWELINYYQGVYEDNVKKWITLVREWK